MDDSMSLYQYTETNSLPCRVKVTEGFCDVNHTDWEFSANDVIDLHRIVCSSVVLCFIDPDSGSQKRISVSSQSPCMFKICPYIPNKPVFLNKPIIVHQVKELVKIWPPMVVTLKEYHDTTKDLSVPGGENLRLKRMVWKDGLQFLECKMQSKTRLVNLSMDSDIGFKLLEDMTAYSLSEICDMPCPVTKRLRLSDDVINKTYTIPGFPQGYTSDVLMDPPQRFVEIHPAESPGEKFVVPVDTDISVSARDGEYGNASFKWYPLQEYVEANLRKLPMVVQLIEWEEEPTCIQATRVAINDHLVLHKHTEMTKFICKFEDSYFAIPICYDGRCRVKPRQFRGIEEVCQASSVRKVKVIRGATLSESNWPGVQKGDILQIGMVEIQKEFKGGRFFDETEVVKIHRNGYKEAEYLPLYLHGDYEEIIDIKLESSKNLSVDQISTSMLPLRVEFFDPPTSFPVSKDPLPKYQCVTITDMYKDSCVLVSKDTVRGYACPVPLHTRISVRFLSKYPKGKPIPQISNLVNCPEELSAEIAETKKSEVIYASAEDDVVPPLLPKRAFEMKGPEPFARRRFESERWNSRVDSGGGGLPDIPSDRHGTMDMPSGLAPPVPPKHRPSANTVQRSRSDPPPQLPSRNQQYPKGAAKSSITLPLACRLLPPGPNQRYSPIKQDCDDDDDDDDDNGYEDVRDLTDYKTVVAGIFGNADPPIITIPSNSNLQDFSWQEMVSFLELTSMPPHSLKLFATDKVDGIKFSRLDDDQLTKYGVNYPMVRHFRNKSK